jgi:predicted metal-dependent hydrolase
MNLSPSEIRERITMTISCSSPEALCDIPVKIKWYVDQLEKMINDCPTCGGVTLACPSCLRADEVHIWIKMQLKKIEKELGEK